MLKRLIFVIFIFVGNFLLAQNQQLANDYFRKGEFEKAADLYQKLYK